MNDKLENNNNIVDNVYVRQNRAKRAFSHLFRNIRADDYFYADLKQVLDIITPHLWENMLDIEQLILGNKLVTNLIDLINGKKIKLSEIEFGKYQPNNLEYNKVQMFGAEVTYLRRYSLITAFGLAAQDSDAVEFGKKPKKEITKLDTAPDDIIKIKKDKVFSLTDFNNITELQKNWLDINIFDANAQPTEQILDDLIAKLEKMKGEII